MQTKKLIIAALAVFMLMSFSRSKTLNMLTGTYSTCGCENPIDGEKKFGLTLNADNTFHYFDYTNPIEKIDVNGNWILSKNIISLKNYSSAFKIEQQWKVEKNGKCIKSRMGLKFTRICNVEACK